jgi:hypothetical protein
MRVPEVEEKDFMGAGEAVTSLLKGFCDFTEVEERETWAGELSDQIWIAIV